LAPPVPSEDKKKGKQVENKPQYVVVAIVTHIPIDYAMWDVRT